MEELHSMLVKKCEYCGREFEASTSSQKYCSKDCSKQRWYRKKIEKIRVSCTTIKGKSLFDWCNENGERGGLILSEYSSKNEQSSKKIAAGSAKKVYWKCNTCGYEWVAKIESRTKLDQGCPSCAGKVLGTNNLYLWCMKNGERGQRLLSEYSSKNELLPEEITPMSGKKVYWKCSTCGHEWEAVVCSRTLHGSNCSSCVRHITETNNLYLWCMENGERGQRILSEYSSKNELSPEEIAPMSGKKVYWECGICGYEWEAVVCSRTNLGCDCPSCAGHITETNNLYLWCMNNGERGQRILSEYSSKNGLTSEEIAPMSSKEAWWKCSTCGFEWKTSLSCRVSTGTDCPKCDKTQTSYGEQILYYILQRELKAHKVLNRAKVEGYEVDVFVPDLKFGIEYSGYTYHADKVEQDKIKIEALKDAGYNVITILEKKSTDGDLDCDFSFVRDRGLNPDEMLDYLKSYMKENYNLDIDVSLSVDEKEVCNKNSAKQYLDIDEVILLQASGKKTKEIAEMLNCTKQLLWHRKRFFTEEELAQKEDDIGCIVLGTKFGDSAEKIASDFELDLDFVKKIQALIEKHKN